MLDDQLDGRKEREPSVPSNLGLMGAEIIIGAGAPLAIPGSGRTPGCNDAYQQHRLTLQPAFEHRAEQPMNQFLLATTEAQMKPDVDASRSCLSRLMCCQLGWAGWDWVRRD
jgi:hypothetical protein